MGLELRYQAMPEECSLLKRARREPEFGSLLPFFETFAKGEEEEEEQPWVDFTLEVQQTIRLYPGIEQRNFSLDRRWDQLYYLLSEARRKGAPRDETNLIYQGIFAGSVLHPDVKAGQGNPIRYLPPADVLQVVALFATVTSEALRVHFNLLAMREAAVYKIRGDKDELDFRYLQQDFEALKTFYEQVVMHQEAVLTCLD